MLTVKVEVRVIDHQTENEHILHGEWCAAAEEDLLVIKARAEYIAKAALEALTRDPVLGHHD